MAKNKPKGQEKKSQNHTKKQTQSGLSAWTWGLIGAGVGLAGWFVIRLISGMIGG
ncbi:MAG: hypothetical protein FD169_1596 [Bacillota bacterium]|nr:MAG: hypothetical protein FD169_1596 [Bacillota bacterium]MBS3949603.1 hypothetical protein [Peptococcaceae bacterium]